LGKRFRYAPTLATVPGHSATVEVALAGMGSTRVKIRTGNDMKLPPPATEFSTPASPAATKSNMAFGRDIEGGQQSTVDSRKNRSNGKAQKSKFKVLLPPSVNPSRVSSRLPFALCLLNFDLLLRAERTGQMAKPKVKIQSSWGQS
jgi:hypothetical protein